ncbi:helix-turn-helix domain-containing protein, partial [Nocardia rhamnosiphila]|uniref:helix-turn-helix domain-containing protein n=1 Tax=Nocardia rhamnosiphila TaxID=426716 RepID=UPI0033E7A7B8
MARWRGRFVRAGLAGLVDEPRPGAPRTISDNDVEEVIVKTLEHAPAGGDTHWSTRGMAKATGLSQSAIWRIWRAFGLKPHLVDTWKLSTDPQFIDKVRDVVGLYLDPPAAALVLCAGSPSSPTVNSADRPTGALSRVRLCGRARFLRVGPVKRSLIVHGETGGRT